MDIGPLVAIMLVCGIAGGIIGNSKGAVVQGFLLGVLLGSPDIQSGESSRIS